MALNSAIAVCNAALGLLGAESIVSFEDRSNEARFCSLFFDAARDETMRGYPWNFAVRQTTLDTPLDSSDDEYPTFGADYAFTLPNSNSDFCLRVLSAYGNEWHKVRGRVLYANSSSIAIEYIRRITNPLYWDASFCMAMAATLAMYLAMPITKSASMMNAMASLSANRIANGYSVDAQEGTPDEIDSNDIIDARLG